MRKWKYNNGVDEDNVELGSLFPNGLPIMINTQNDEEPTYSTSGIRVVENKIFFYGDVDESSALELNRLLVENDLKAQNTKNILGDDYDPVVHLHVNTYGGGIFAAFSTVDTIRQMKSKVYTYVDGSVASAGTLIVAAGSKRFVGAHAHMLIHQLSGGMYGKYEELVEEMGNHERLMKLLKDFYKKNTKLPMKKLDEILKRDLWLSAEESVQFGLVDSIL